MDVVGLGKANIGFWMSSHTLDASHGFVPRSRWWCGWIITYSDLIVVRRPAKPIFGSRSFWIGSRHLSIAYSISGAILHFLSAISVGSFFKTPQTPDFRAWGRGPCHTLLKSFWESKNASKSVWIIFPNLQNQQICGVFEKLGLGSVFLVCELFDRGTRIGIWSIYQRLGDKSPGF